MSYSSGDTVIAKKAIYNNGPDNEAPLLMASAGERLTVVEGGSESLKVHPEAYPACDFYCSSSQVSPG
jgi:hypothetical protein